MAIIVQLTRMMVVFIKLSRVRWLGGSSLLHRWVSGRARS
jgi:hypothetical protein